MKKLLFFTCLGILLVIFFTSTVRAQGIGASENPLGSITLPGDLAESTKPTNIINSLVGLIISIAGLLFFFYFLIGGIRYMTAGGDSKAIGAATSAITTALIGFLLVISAYFIALFISEVFNIEILRPNIPVLQGL